MYRKFQLANEALDVKKTFEGVKSARECAGLAFVNNWYHFKHRESDLRCDLGEADLDMSGDQLIYAKGEAQNHTAVTHAPFGVGVCDSLVFMMSCSIGTVQKNKSYP